MSSNAVFIVVLLGSLLYHCWNRQNREFLCVSHESVVSGRTHRVIKDLFIQLPQAPEPVAQLGFGRLGMQSPLGRSKARQWRDLQRPTPFGLVSRRPAN